MQPLVVVHAGSFFGSADFNIGPEESELRRGYLYKTLSNWRGPMVRTVTEIDQDVEESSCIDQRLADKLLSMDSIGDIDSELCDFAFLWDGKEVASYLGLRKGQIVWVTGAWYGQSGCVNETARVLKYLGFKPKIHDSTLPELFWNDKKFNEYAGSMKDGTWKPRPRGMQMNWKA